MSERCCKRVYTGSFTGHPCTKPANFKYDGKMYCKIHFPPNVTERRDANYVKYTEKMKAKRPEWYGYAARNILAKIRAADYNVSGDVIASIEKYFKELEAD